jgi:DNA-binding NarL/FixJ family response regulator
MPQKIMVVDDNYYVVETVMDLLGKQYDVYPALTPAKMHELLATESFALVVLDLALAARTSGLEFAEAIKKTGAKILVLTGYVDTQITLACIRAGVSCILDKQDAVHHLLSMAEAVLAGFDMGDPALLAPSNAEQDHLPYLSRSECTLLNWLFANPDATNAQVGARFNLSEAVATAKLGKLGRKVDAHDRPQLLAELLRRGYQPLEPDEAEAAPVAA